MGGGTIGTEWVEAGCIVMHMRASLNKLYSPKGPDCMILNSGSFSSFKIGQILIQARALHLSPERANPTAEWHLFGCPTGTRPQSTLARAHPQSRRQSHSGTLALRLGPALLPGRGADLTGHQDRLYHT